MQTLSFIHAWTKYSEINLVVLCLRSHLSGGKNDSDLREFLKGPGPERPNWCFDFDELLREAEYHSTAACVAYALLQSGEDLLPQEVCAKLQQRLHVAARNNLKWLAEWQRILATFQSAGIRVISFKGPVLAMQAYGNLALREFADLDLLVMPEDALRARDVLVEEGYQPRISRADDENSLYLRSGNQQLEFVSAERGTQIDMHWGALHKMFPFQLPVNTLFQSSRISRIEENSFLSLSPEHTLLYLCAHGTKHYWARLHWLCDVACYVKSTQELDWKQCVLLAKETNCELVVKHALLLAKSVLELELPQEVKSFCQDSEAQKLADKARAFLFGASAKALHGKQVRYHLAFAKGWRDGARYLRNRIFVPAEPDWDAIWLPQLLHPLYYFVRPLRMIFVSLSRTASRPG